MAKEKRKRAAHPDNAPPLLDDLRAELPKPYRDAQEAEIPRLWLAWKAARRQRSREYLVAAIGVPRSIAEDMLTRARDQSRGGE